MRVLVTGGAGFIGTHLCARLLAEGHYVICLDNLSTGSIRHLVPFLTNGSFEFIRHDITSSLEFLRGSSIDCLFHLACPASPVAYQADPIKTLQTCILGTMHALELAQITPRCRFIHASTSEIYGDPSEHPQKESYWGHVNPIGLRSCYDEGKRAAETLVYDYARQRNVSVRVARIFNTYGPHLQPNDGRVVSSFILQALRNEPLTIYGDGTQTRTLCYVSDLVDGLLRLARCPMDNAGPVNLGGTVEISVFDLARDILTLTYSTSPLAFVGLPDDDPKRRKPDLTRAKALLGWAPLIDLAAGLSRTIAYFRETLYADEDF